MPDRSKQPPDTASSGRHPTCIEAGRAWQQLALLSTETRGSVLVEYIVVAAFAGLLVLFALLAVGPETVRNYSGQRASLYQTSP